MSSVSETKGYGCGLAILENTPNTAKGHTRLTLTFQKGPVGASYLLCFILLCSAPPCSALRHASIRSALLSFANLLALFGCTNCYVLLHFALSHIRTYVYVCIHRPFHMIWHGIIASRRMQVHTTHGAEGSKSPRLSTMSLPLGCAPVPLS